MSKTVLNIGSIAAVVLLASPVHAATTLVDEDWQSGTTANLRLDDTTTHHPGWQFTQGNGNIFVHRYSPANGLPGGTLGTANQAVQFEWDGANAEYDTGHNWSASDVYTLTFNATEMNWSNAADRYITVELTETNRDGSGNLLGAPIWSGVVQLPQYNTAHDGAAEDWSADQTFTFNFSAGDFTGGTEGSALTFEIGGGGGSPSNRGTYVDNISLVLIPEPSSMALVGLGALSLLGFRRRRI